MVVSGQQQELTDYLYKGEEERMKIEGRVYENPSAQIDKKSSEGSTEKE